MAGHRRGTGSLLQEKWEGRRTDRRDRIHLIGEAVEKIKKDEGKMEGRNQERLGSGAPCFKDFEEDEY